MLLGLAIVYRYGPDRQNPQWRWVSWGAVIATVLWIVAAALAGVPWLRFPAPESEWTRFWFQHPLGDPATGPEIRSGVEWVPAIGGRHGR